MALLEKEFYSVKELRELLGVADKTVRRLMYRGEIDYYRIGRQVRFERGDIESYLQRTRVTMAISKRRAARRPHDRRTT